MSYTYFDNSATTQLDPHVRESMRFYYTDEFGNPSSLHHRGLASREAIEAARSEVAGLIGAKPQEIIFTSSGTEADNLALIGVADQYRRSNVHIITSVIEHPAILATCRYLAQWGVEISYVPVGRDGCVDPEDIIKLIQPNTRIVSIMAANNIVGTLQPISEIATLLHGRGILFHTDAVQGFGKIPIDVRTMPIDLISCSAHKLHGPKGVGALYVRSGVTLSPLMYGGGQERGLRSSTENVAGIVGFGCAAKIASSEISHETARMVKLREKIITSISELCPQVYVIGHRYKRLPGHVCLGVEGREGEAIRILLDLDNAGFAISSGSACSAYHTGEPSGVLVAMGYNPIKARGSIRITLGRFNTEEEVDRFIKIFSKIIDRPRYSEGLTDSETISKRREYVF